MLDTISTEELAEVAELVRLFETAGDPCHTCSADVTDHRHRTPLGFGCALTGCLQFVRTGSK